MNISLYPIKLFFSQRLVIWPLIISIAVNICMWGYILIVFPPTAEIVFLHYNILFGVDLVGPWWRLLMTPILGLVILFVNLCIAWVSYQYDRLIAVVLLSSALLMQVLLLLATYQIIFFNT